MSRQLQDYHYRGARACVLLHEKSIKYFVKVWRKSKEEGVRLPETEDPNYASLDTLMSHVLNWARTYMIWICQQLELPDPEIKQPPAVTALEDRLDGYVKHLLLQWRKPLKTVKVKQFYKQVYPSPWKTEYCIDAMLEHAIMHPRRHAFQLKELM